MLRRVHRGSGVVIEANADLKAETKAFIWGEGPDDASLFDEVDRGAERAELAKAQAQA